MFIVYNWHLMSVIKICLLFWCSYVKGYPKNMLCLSNNSLGYLGVIMLKFPILLPLSINMTWNPVNYWCPTLMQMYLSIQRAVPMVESTTCHQTCLQQCTILPYCTWSQVFYCLSKIVRRWEQTLHSHKYTKYTVLMANIKMESFIVFLPMRTSSFDQFYCYK